MASTVVNEWRFVGVILALFLTSCTKIEHRAEVDQAVRSLERTAGLRAPWAETFNLEELQLDETRRLTLEQALKLALANNRALRADLEGIGQAKTDLVPAGLLSNPMLSMMLGFPDGGGLPQFAFGLSKDFTDLWLIPSRKRAAQAMLQQRVLSFTDTALALVTEVRANYYALQYLMLAIDLQEQNLRILQQAIDLASARLRAGEAAQLDVNLLRARHLETQLELLQLRSDFRGMQRILLRQMGVARAPDDWAPEAMSLEAPVIPLGCAEELLVEAALAQRLDVQAASWELESAVADLAQQRGRVIQNLGIGVSGQRFERRALPGRNILGDTARASVAAGQLTAPEIESRAQRRRMRNQEIETIIGPSLEISLPIFDQNQAQIAKAQFLARELRQRHEEARQRVVEGVRAALVQRHLAAERVGVFRESLVPLQDNNLQLAEAAYQTGRESVLTVLLAQESQIQTRLGLAGALRDLATSTANLERQLAGRLPDLDSPAPTSAPASDSQPSVRAADDPVEPRAAD